jgi:predicted DNA-binding protein
MYIEDVSTTPHSSFRFSPDVKRMLETLARREGTTKTAVLARLVREAAGKKAR